MGRRPGVPKVELRPGKTVYTCRFTANGKRYDVSTGETDRDRALEAAHRLQAEALLGRQRPKRRRVRASDQASLEDLSAEYLEHVEAKGLADSYFLAQAKHFRYHFLPRWSSLGELTTQALERYPAERAREKTNRNKPPTTVTIYKEQVTLARFLEWCKVMGHLEEVPAFTRVIPISDYKPVDLTADEAKALLSALPTRREHPKRYAARERFTVQWAQGLRYGDVSKLRWSDVDLTRGLVTYRQSNDKGRVGRTVELSAPARAVLEELAAEPHLPDALIFGHSNLRASLDLAVERAKVPRITSHGFRHSRLSELAAATHDTAAIQHIAGHASMSTTDKYVRSRAARTGAVFTAADSGGPKKPAARKQPATARRRR